MFVDEIEIEVYAGDGGDGCVAFLREKFKPKGGPAGGDGGRGGNVFIQVHDGLLTLMDFRGKKIFKTKRGGNGEGNNKKGRRGADVTIQVPPGTVVTDIKTGKIIADISSKSEPVLVASGGKGGRGNSRFASPTHQTPKKYTPGIPGEIKRLHLELKIIADIGCVGFPSAGKSSLVSLVSTADPKQAEYHFTTLSPKIGHINLGGYYRVTIADLPGLIEDAHHGRGLGHQFLRHIQRTGSLVHIIAWRDEFAEGPSEFKDDFDVIMNEMKEFDDALISKSRFTVLNKIDKIPPELDRNEIYANLQEILGDEKLYVMSVYEHTGVEELVSRISKEILIEKGELVEGLPAEFSIPDEE